MITNDAVIFGMLMLFLAVVFHTSRSENKFFKKLYSVIPTIFICYFGPSLLNTLKIVDLTNSQLYFVASRYLLPAALFLLTISVDLRQIYRLGSKAIVMFLTGTAGIVLGGPIALFLTELLFPGSLEVETWRGLTTIAGSWIGGGANQTAMKEVFDVPDALFGSMVTVDIIAANFWLAILFFGIGKNARINRFLKADDSAIESVKKELQDYQSKIDARFNLLTISTTLALAFGATAIAHFVSDQLAPWLDTNFPQLRAISFTSGFFWLVIVTTMLGVGSSLTRLKKVGERGSMEFGSLFIYVLVAVIGLKMDVSTILDSPSLFFTGFVWVTFHGLLLLLVAKLIKAPFFFVAVGSQANIGGAASAPVVASAFHPTLATVGVLLAVLGYAVGTFGAFICGLLLKGISNGF